MQKKTSGHPTASTEHLTHSASAHGVYGVPTVVDTSFLYEELRRKYRLANGAPIPVDFRELVSWVKLGDQLTHQIHPYPAKLLPSIAHFFARTSAIVKPGSYILDPFCGSGTVALEASLAGHNPLVCDANPLSLLITKVKTSTYDTNRLRELTKAIVSRAGRLRTAPAIDVVNSHLWYEPSQKLSLEKLMRAIAELEDEAERDFFRVCFSVVARKISFADPSISVPVRVKQKSSFSDAVNLRIEKKLAWIRTACPRAEFQKISEANIGRVEKTQTAFPKRQIATCIGTDVRALSQKNNNNDDTCLMGKVEMVITSPPYGSAQKYVRASSLSLNWLGLTKPNELASLESKSIGREHAPGPGIRREETFAEPFENLLENLKEKNPLRYEITLQYLLDMKKALYEIYKIVAPGGHVVIVVGNNQVCGEVLRNDELCTSTMRALGMKLELHLIDEIKSRGLLTKRKSSAQIILRESILVFSKPVQTVKNDA